MDKEIEELKRKIAEAERNAVNAWYMLGNYNKALVRVEELKGELAALQSIAKAKMAAESRKGVEQL